MGDLKKLAQEITEDWFDRPQRHRHYTRDHMEEIILRHLRAHMETEPCGECGGSRRVPDDPIRTDEGVVLHGVTKPCPSCSGGGVRDA